jgi:hypothetical protein
MIYIKERIVHNIRNVESVVKKVSEVKFRALYSNCKFVSSTRVPSMTRLVSWVWQAIKVL